MKYRNAVSFCIFLIVEEAKWIVFHDYFKVSQVGSYGLYAGNSSQNLILYALKVDKVETVYDYWVIISVLSSGHCGI